MKSRAEKIEQTPNPAIVEIVKQMPDYIQLTEDYAAIQQIAKKLQERIQLRETLFNALQSAKTAGDKEKMRECAERMMTISEEITKLAKTADQKKNRRY